MIDFPASPTVGQLATLTNGVTYRWDGAIWVAVGASAGGDFTAVLTANTAAPVSLASVPFTTIICGNSGGWYNTSDGHYVPPAGRYFLSANANAIGGATQQLSGALRKNGANITEVYATNGINNTNVQISLSAEVDASGSDYFEFALAGVNNGLTLLPLSSFSAFPISGIKGPPGDTGPPGATGGVIMNYLTGCTLSRSAARVVGVAVGQFADSTNAAMVGGGVFTKSLSGTWVAGTGANGRGTGVALTANAWYHVFGGQQAGGAYDVWFDTSVTGANKPAAFTNFRRLGSVKLDASSNIVPFTQDGDNFWWTTEVDDPTGTATGLIALTVPPGVRVMWQGNIYVSITTGTTNTWVSTPGVVMSVGQAAPVVSAAGVNGAATISILTNTARQVLITLFSSGGTATFTTETRGWIDTRGRNG